jgi:type VI secretion system protein ImpL
MSPSLLAAIIGLLVILLIVGIILVVRASLIKATKVTVIPGAPAEAEEPVRKPGDIAPPATLRTALAIAMRELRVMVGGGRGPTEVPWSLVIGAGGEDLLPLLPPPVDEDYAMGWLDEKNLARAGTVSFRTGGVVLGFEDGLVGQAQAERRLMDLLREVEVIRPDRPLDSLVIAVPWSLLHEGDEAALNARGRQLYNLILTVQQRTGWRLPVYVLVTEAEKLPGFAAIGRAVLAHALNPVVGWAAPRTLDSVFQPSWVDDAFDAMCGALSIEQLHVLMGIEGEVIDTGLEPGANDQLSEAVLLLPARLAAVLPALRLLMTGMLENSVYHEAFMLRGIFLTGETEAQPLAIGPADAAAGETEAPAAEGKLPAPRPAQRLAQLLFLEKIFPESGLAQPAYGERTRRHRMIRRTQIALATACLCFVIGIGLIRYYGGHSVPPLDALLRNIASIEVAADQNRAETRDAAGACSERKTRFGSEKTEKEFQESRKTSVQLLQRMSELDLHRIEIWLAPTSYFSGANEMVESAIKKSFHDVVFNAIGDSMATPAGITALLAGDRPVEFWRPDEKFRYSRADLRAADSDSTDDAVDDRSDIAPMGGDFEGYWGSTLRNVATYDRHFQLASDMSGKTPEGVGVLRGFSEVVQYSLGEQLPPQFTRNYRVYSEGITEASVPCLNTTIVQDTLRRIIAKRYRTAARIYYLGNPVSESWYRISGWVDDKAETGISEEGLRKLVEDIDTMAAALAEPRRYAWIYASGVDLPLPNMAGFEGLETVRTAQLTDLPGQALILAERQAQALQSAQLFGAPLLERDASPEALALLAKPALPSVATAPVNPPTVLPKLSQPAIDTRNFLRALFAQPFMVPTSEPGTGFAGPRTGWDIARLQAVQGALKNYTDFLAQGSGQMPGALHKIATDISALRFGQYSEHLLDQAAQPLSSVIGGGGQNPTEARAANFGQALPLLINIRDTLRAVGAGDVAARLDQRVAEQAGQLLADTDRDLDNGGGPYAVDDSSLAAWDGTGSVAAAAYGVDTIDDLKATLPQRRGRVVALARGRAAALVTYLRDTPAASAANLSRANRWQAILQTLDAYDGNSPSNSLSRLEQYITVDLDKLDWRDCARMRGARSRQGDYFAQQQAAITIKLIGRCRRVATDTIEGKYAGLRQLFNATLAVRFPFSTYVSSPGADPANVQAFYAQYGPILPQLKEALEGAANGGEGTRQAAVVLGQLIEVEKALGPMLDAGEATLSYKVDVDFFPNLPIAVGQSQVLGASIGTPESLARDNGVGNFTWNNGEPVAVRLRWAANAPTLPMTEDGKCVPQPGGNVFGHDVAGNWALLRLLRAQGPSPRIGEAAPGIAIAFEVPLCENRARASGGDPVRDRARIFLRLSLSKTVHTPDKPDRQVPVILPPFPESVPSLLMGPGR